MICIQVKLIVILKYKMIFLIVLIVTLIIAKIAILTYAISNDEVKWVLSRAAKNKSPGIDGISYEFYMFFFYLVGNDIVNVFNDIFRRGNLSESQSTAIITLTPKKGDTLNPSNWRPISLLNADYKILAKVLQSRLSNVMYCK